MKVDILFNLAYLCLLIGSIQAANEPEKNDTKSTTTVPSAAITTSSPELNDTTVPNDTTVTNATEVPTEITTNATSEVSSVAPASLPLTNGTDPPATNSSSTTDSGKTTQTTDLSTGENSPTTAPSKGGTPGGFNALSFIGGIVFTVGLLAIMYVGFKFYKSRTERNYHTL